MHCSGHSHRVGKRQTRDANIVSSKQSHEHKFLHTLSLFSRARTRTDGGARVQGFDPGEHGSKLLCRHLAPHANTNGGERPSCKVRHKPSANNSPFPSGDPPFPLPCYCTVTPGLALVRASAHSTGALLVRLVAFLAVSKCSAGERRKSKIRVEMSIGSRSVRVCLAQAGVGRIWVLKTGTQCA